MRLPSFLQSRSAAKTTAPQEQQQPSSAEPSALWRRGAFRVHSLGGHFHAVHAPHGETRVFPPFAVEFVLSCDQFRPLQKHIEQYAGEHGWDTLQIEALRRCLREIIDAELLVSTESLTRRCQAMRNPDHKASVIETIGIPTGGNRTELLERAVRSFSENLKKHDRQAEFLVADNSSLPEHQAAFRQLLQTLTPGFPGTLRISSGKEKRLFADHLIRDGKFSPEAVEFALFDPLQTGFSCGANRNAILLETAGKAFCSIDDDVTCRLANALEESSNGLACFSNTDPFSRWLFPDRESALAQARWVDCDYLALHEKLLGRDVGEVFSSAGSPSSIDWREAGDSFLRRSTSSNGVIRATFTGHIGDPGIPTSTYFLYYTAENRRRLTESEAHYRSVFTSRNVFSAVRETAIGDASVSPGMAFALDHRELLPPCFPVLHAEDFSYGAMLWQCCPGAFMGHLPTAVYHDPGTGKPILHPQALGREKYAVIFEFAHLLRGAILHFEPPETAGAAERMQALGRHLGEFAALPSADFAEYLRYEAIEHASERSEFLAKQLEKAEDAPDFWREDVEALIDHFREAITRDDADIPLDLQSQRPASETRELMRQLYRRYALLLQEWPAMIEFARELRSNGQSLFQPVA